MLKVIYLTVDREGNVTLQTKGYAGSSCKTATQALEQSLGIKAQEQFTSEYYQAQTAESKEHLRQ